MGEQYLVWEGKENFRGFCDFREIDQASLLYQKFHKINFKEGGSYIDSPEWIKNKKATINPINKKVNKCFE